MERKTNEGYTQKRPLDLSNYKDKLGDKIAIQAVDVIGLTHVDMNILAQDGTSNEQGEATEAGSMGSGKWTYTATKPVAVGT